MHCVYGPLRPQVSLARKILKAEMLRWVLLLQSFDFDVVDTKGAENLRLFSITIRDPHKNKLIKELNEKFPLETLSSIASLMLVPHGLIARIVKNSRACIFIKSFTSSASFWESNEKVPSELKRVIMHGRTDKKLTQAQLAQGRTDKKLTQAQLAQMINEKPQIIQETISTTEEVFLAAEFPTVHVVEPSPIIITPSSITAPMPDLLDLGPSGEDNSVIVPIDQPASPIGLDTLTTERVDQLTVANIHSHTRPQAMKCLVTMSEVLGDHIWLASMETWSS
ncbi:hypothetical protein Tco_1213935 [Tanacetum coccineum]